MSGLVWLAGWVTADHWNGDWFGRPLLACVSTFFIAYAIAAWPAGRYAETRERRQLMLIGMSIELAAMVLASVGIYLAVWPFVFVGVALCGVAKALYDPTRLALVAQWFSPRSLVRANGWLWLVGWSGAVIGLGIAKSLKDFTGNGANEWNFPLVPLVLGGMVVAGMLGLMSMSKTPAESGVKSSPWADWLNPWLGLRALLGNAPLLRLSAGIVLFWAFATVALLATAQFAGESVGTTQSNQTAALIWLTIGIGLGGLWVGWASIGRVELGLVPWGALVAVAALITLSASSGDALVAFGLDGFSLGSRIGFLCLGWGASFFLIPLVSYFQQHADAEVRVAMLDATNMLAAISVVVGLAFYAYAHVPTRQGNYANLPPEYQFAALPLSRQVIVNDALQKLTTDAAGESGRTLDEKLDEFDRAVRLLLPESMRTVLTGELIKADFPRRGLSAEDAIRYYQRQFPDWTEDRIRQEIDPKAKRFPRPPAAPLAPEEELRLKSQADLVLKNLETAWDATDRYRQRHVAQQWPTPGLNALLLTASTTEMRRAGLGQLLWNHLRARSSVNDSIREREYTALFPGDEESSMTVKRVVAQALPQPRMAARQIFLTWGLLAIPVFLYSMWRVPQAMARLPLWWAFRCVYRVRVNGVENIPLNGGAVLVINHSTWIDGLIILLMSSRRIRMIAWAGNFNSRIMKILARFAQVILITGGPKSIQKGLSEGRRALQRGELVGIFPEGGITRTGQVREFRPGIMKILDQMPVPLIPVYIDQIWGSIFSYSGGKTIWKLPNAFRHRVTINIGPPLWRPESIYQVRRAVLEEGATAVSQRQPPFAAPVQMFIRACKKRRFKSKIADSMGQELSGGMLLTRSLILRDLLKKHVLAPDEKIVGVLIPPSTGGVIANMALALDRRVAVHVNYTLSERLINETLRIADVKHVLTTRKVMEKFNFKLKAEVYFLDDLKEKVTTSSKLLAMLRAFVPPAGWLEARLGLNRLPPDELLTVIFTSGSTGTPKGVMLSQRNIATNVEAIGQVICLNPRDTLIGALPFFHSFGYTITLWGAMGLDVRGAYHFSPLEATQVGKLTRTYQGTVLLGTPTFLRTYLRKCTPDDFASLNTVVAGAEKLPVELAVAFDHRFGVRPVEGYGTTELSPLVSVNVPASRALKNFQVDAKEGTVGRTVPNVVAKITDLDDPKRELGANASGMLWIKGPNVMLGYMHRPDLTAEVIVDGWYCTGDVAEIDDEGFITLTGRMSRFSKIGGEMIPHIQIEEALTSILNEENYETQKVAVTAVPDPKRGERLVVLHTRLTQSPAELCRRLRESGLPNLFIPSEDSFFEVDEIPILGSGKLDLKRMKEVAVQVAGQTAAR